MITVNIAGGKRQFPTGARFYTEDDFNNLCIEDEQERLVAVFAHDKWTYVEVDTDGAET